MLDFGPFAIWGAPLPSEIAGQMTSFHSLPKLFRAAVDLGVICESDEGKFDCMFGSGWERKKSAVSHSPWKSIIANLEGVICEELVTQIHWFPKERLCSFLEQLNLPIDRLLSSSELAKVQERRKNEEKRREPVVIRLDSTVTPTKSEHTRRKQLPPPSKKRKTTSSQRTKGKKHKLASKKRADVNPKRVVAVNDTPSQPSQPTPAMAPVVRIDGVPCEYLTFGD